MRVLRFVLSLALGIALPLAVQLWDRRRLDEEQRARAWNGATWGAALYAFSVFSMLGWFWVTRGGWRGRRALAREPGRAIGAAAKAIVLGVASTITLLTVLVLADQLVVKLLGLPPDP
jgi:hypothetical protein